MKVRTVIKQTISYMLNIVTPTYKNRIYVRLRQPSSAAKIDLLNPGTSNLLSFLQAFVCQGGDRKTLVYLEYSDPDRLALYKSFLKEKGAKSVSVRFVKSHGYAQSRLKKAFSRLGNLVRRMTARFWLCETGDTHFSGKLPCQKIICYNYFISCKNDLIEARSLRWKSLSYCLTTSLLSSQIISSSIGVRLDHCLPLGFPRNDCLFRQDKREAILSWIFHKTKSRPKHIFLYAPTFRDYDLDNEEKNQLFWQKSDRLKNEKMAREISKIRPLLGYEAEDLPRFLKETESVLIHHLHPLQKTSVFEKSDCMIAYENNYDFSVYDLMAIADCMITDYSSIGYDFLLTDRPLIYNLYDLEVYSKLRGLSYDPYEAFCPGQIVTDWEGMKKALSDVTNGIDDYREKRASVRSLLFKNPDGNATQRVLDWFDKDIMKHHL